jgi:hypothetical protein
MPVRKTSDKAITKNLRQLPKPQNEVLVLTIHDGGGDRPDNEAWEKEMKMRSNEMKSGRIQGLTIQAIEIELSTGEIAELETVTDYSIRFHPGVLEEFKIIRDNQKDKATMARILETVKAKMKEIDEALGSDPAKLNKLKSVSIEIPK